jgi:hypothetical protein
MDLWLIVYALSGPIGIDLLLAGAAMFALAGWWTFRR